MIQQVSVQKPARTNAGNIKQKVRFWTNRINQCGLDCHLWKQRFSASEAVWLHSGEQLSSNFLLLFVTQTATEQNKWYDLLC